MYKWQRLAIAGLSGISLWAPAFAGDPAAIFPKQDTLGCTALIKQGDANPAMPSADLSTLQTCMRSCDRLYAGFGDQGRYVDMIHGAAYCRKSLNNLYFASVSEVINNQLDAQTQQKAAAQQQMTMDYITKLLQQRQQQSPQATQPATPAPNNTTQPQEPEYTPAPTPQPQPVLGPPDNVNW
jgi:hypothetical protein